ncbi:hypothetical protein J2S98_004588 [Arthrobacter oryzae]|nr:hypothetical protein [Arthrobacter oryzae]
MGPVLAPVVRGDQNGVGVVLGGRFPVLPFGGGDVEVVVVGVVSGILHDGRSLGFQIGDQRGEGGGAFAPVAQPLRDVQKLVRFVHDHRLELLRGLFI